MKNSLSITDFQMCCVTVVACYAIKRVFNYLDGEDLLLTHDYVSNRYELITSKH